MLRRLRRPDLIGADLKLDEFFVGKLAPPSRRQRAATTSRGAALRRTRAARRFAASGCQHRRHGANWLSYPPPYVGAGSTASLDRPIPVTLPPQSEPRERHLTRCEGGPALCGVRSASTLAASGTPFASTAIWHGSFCSGSTPARGITQFCGCNGCRTRPGAGSTSRPGCSIAARGVPWRAASGDRLSQSRRAYFRTCGAGGGIQRAILIEWRGITDRLAGAPRMAASARTGGPQR